MLYLCAATIPEENLGDEVEIVGSGNAPDEPFAAVLHFFAVIDANAKDAKEAVRLFCGDQSLTIFDVILSHECVLDDLPAELLKSLPKGKGLVRDLGIQIGLAEDDEECRTQAVELAYDVWMSGK